MKIEKRLELSNAYEIGYDVDYYYRTCHQHDFYEILIILNGNAIHCVNKNVQILKKGDALCIRPDDAHYIAPYNSESTEKFEFFNLRVSQKYMKTQFSYCKNLENKICNPTLPFVVRLGTKEMLFFCKKLHMLKMMEPCDAKEFVYYSVVKALLMQILMSNFEAKDEIMPEWFKNLLIQLSKPDIFCLDYLEIVKIANVSNSYFWKTFKKYLNMSPTEYINTLRVEYAYELVVNTNDSFSVIASNIGFNDYSYFYKKFLNKFGMSPKTLRQQYRQKGVL